MRLDYIPSNGETKRAVRRKIPAAAAVCAAVVVAVTGGAGSAETLVERGAYLVTTVAACGIAIRRGMRWESQ